MLADTGVSQARQAGRRISLSPAAHCSHQEHTCSLQGGGQEDHVCHLISRCASDVSAEYGWYVYARCARAYGVLVGCPLRWWFAWRLASRSTRYPARVSRVVDGLHHLAQRQRRQSQTWGIVSLSTTALVCCSVVLVWPGPRASTGGLSHGLGVAPLGVAQQNGHPTNPWGCLADLLQRGDESVEHAKPKSEAKQQLQKLAILLRDDVAGSAQERLDAAGSVAQRQQHELGEAQVCGSGFPPGA